jgi:uncharacterized SAM-binding protein YcdF (DUF218 family)
VLLALAGILAYAAAPRLRPWAGRLLVRDDAPEPADLVVVLGGDFWGSRVLTGASLVARGFAPAVLISGPPYGIMPESRLAIEWLIQRGNPAQQFIEYPIPLSSTVSEAHALLRELRRRHTRNFLLVTSNYHSRRAGLIFRILCPACRFRVIAAPETAFSPNSWWRNEGSRNLFWKELPKLLAAPFACIAELVVPSR